MNTKIYTIDFIEPMQEEIYRRMSEVEFLKYLKRKMIQEMLSKIEEEDEFRLQMQTNPYTGEKRYQIQSCFIDTDKFERLYRIIEKNDFVVFDENGDKIRLLDLL